MGKQLTVMSHSELRSNAVMFAASGEGSAHHCSPIAGFVLIHAETLACPQMPWGNHPATDTILLT